MDRSSAEYEQGLGEPGMPSPFSLRGRRVVVTGAGRGLGAEAAVALGRAGAMVVLGARNVSAAEIVAKVIVAAGGCAEAYQLDVTNTGSVKAFFRNASQSGELHGLVNNAGVTRSGRVRDMTDADWGEVLDVNLTGTFRCVREFLTCSGPTASIVNIGSLAAVTGIVGEPAYSASKGGVEAMTRSLAAEAARFGIRVNAVSPGYFNTEMSQAALTDDTVSRKLIAKIPLRRIAEPEEIGPSIVFLLSSASSYITGAIIRVDGGYTAI